MAKKRRDGRIQKSFTYNGKRYFVYGKTRKELAEKELLKRQELQAGQDRRENPTLNQYYETFTENRRGTVKETTIATQRCEFSRMEAITMTGNKNLGQLHIREITPQDMQKVQAVLSSSELTTNSVNHHMIHLKHVFNQAVKDEVIDRNPCNCINNLKRTEAPARDNIHRALTPEETEAFFKSARQRNSFYLNLFTVMIQTGMRVGEVGALTPFDIDEKEGYIHVRKTLTRSEVGAVVIGDSTKTKAGMRDIPLMLPVLEAIREQRKTNSMLFTVMPETIFTTTTGKYIKSLNVDREIGVICKAAGIERFTSHAFRATFATRFIEQRPEEFKVLAEILGHGDIKITLNLYTHVMDEQKKNAMENIVIKMG